MATCGSNADRVLPGSTGGGFESCVPHASSRFGAGLGPAL